MTARASKTGLGTGHRTTEADTSQKHRSEQRPRKSPGAVESAENPGATADSICAEALFQSFSLHGVCVRILPNQPEGRSGTESRATERLQRKVPAFRLPYLRKNWNQKNLERPSDRAAAVRRKQPPEAPLPRCLKGPSQCRATTHQARLGRESKGWIMRSASASKSLQGSSSAFHLEPDTGFRV